MTISLQYSRDIRGCISLCTGKSTPIASLGAVALKQTNVESVATVAMAIHCMASSKRLECVVVNRWDDFSRECSTYNTLGRALCVLI